MAHHCPDCGMTCHCNGDIDDCIFGNGWKRCTHCPLDGEVGASRQRALKVRTEMTLAWLQMDGWEGRTQQAVEVIGETPKRNRIRAIGRTKLAGRQRWINKGETSLVPKHAVRAVEAPGVAVVKFD